VLEKQSSEHSSVWRNTLAGLAALRLLDVWADGTPLPEAGIQALDNAINMMDVDTLQRAPLRRLANELSEERNGRRTHHESTVLRSVPPYAEALWNDAEWTLAIDVCQTAINHAETIGEPALVPSLYDHRSLRQSA
jgi:hypothetical protein